MPHQILAKKSQNLFQAAIVAIAVLAFLDHTSSARAQEKRTMLQSIHPSALREASLGELLATQNLRFAISLPLRNQEALAAKLGRLYDPASPDYHHWLTSPEFTEQFGPAESDLQKVTRSPGNTASAWKRFSPTAWSWMWPGRFQALRRRSTSAWSGASIRQRIGITSRRTCNLR